MSSHNCPQVSTDSLVVDVATSFDMFVAHATVAGRNAAPGGCWLGINNLVESLVADYSSTSLIVVVVTAAIDVNVVTLTFYNFSYYVMMAMQK